MIELGVKEFATFYAAIHGFEPYPWQKRLVETILTTGKWPDNIGVPTGCGKTSCIDIAVYVLACRPEKNPRRIAYVVNRRIIVDEGFERAKKIIDKLDTGSDPILRDVRQNLCELSGSNIALKCAVLRGGTFIDKDWTTDPSVPCIISSTVDHAGSRLLFRGYGVGTKSRVVHAGLLGSDCLWLLDETHISKPFTATLRAVERFKGQPWLDDGHLSRPWSVVEMTATPGKKTKNELGLSDEDYQNASILRKINASKPCRLEKSNAKDSDDYEKLAEDLKKHTLEMKDSGIKTIAVVANRVKTAKIVYQKLLDADYEVHLVIGRMRPLDRDIVWNNLRHLKTCAENTRDAIVVTTQCLEVGADLDFEGMVTEASSLDSLIQRFGRLNRSGNHNNSAGVIVAPKSVHQKKHCSDPIYGETPCKTFEFLQNVKELNFGIGKLREILESCTDKNDLIVKISKYPELLPYNLDVLCQTHSHLISEPDIAPFLHGFERGMQTVSVVWRTHHDNNIFVYDMAPRSAEAMQVPIWDIRKYLAQGGEITGGDAEWQMTLPSQNGNVHTSTKIWRERHHQNELVYFDKVYNCWMCQVIKRGQEPKEQKIEFDTNSIRPGDIVVLPAEDRTTLNELGHVPKTDEVFIDVAESVTFKETKKVVIRLGKDFPFPLIPEARDLLSARTEERRDEITELEETLVNSLKTKHLDVLSRIVGTKLDDYLNSPDLSYDVVLVDAESILMKMWHRGRKSSGHTDEFLQEHSESVAKTVSNYANKLNMNDELAELFNHAALVHDIGKADYRFQQMLYRSLLHPPRLRAKDTGRPLKNGMDPRPKKFRHELVSSSLVRDFKTCDNDLFLHLIESHHGYCRPFVPIVFDSENPTVEYPFENKKLQSSAETRMERVGSGASERFWKCTRRYGWWGLAWLESIFLLADWNVSGDTN